MKYQFDLQLQRHHWPSRPTATPASARSRRGQDHLHLLGRGDADFVAGTAGLIKSVRKPGGDCSTTTLNRKLCTSYTYDAAGRVKTVTDGKQRQATTGLRHPGPDHRRLLQRRHQLRPPTNCTTYTYDAEGNLTNANRSGRQDRLHLRPDEPADPTQQPSASGAVVLTMSYDGVGNLTQLRPVASAAPADQPVTYAYDDGNFVTSITDSAGTTSIEVDDDGYARSNTSLPGDNGVKVDYDIDDYGKPANAERHPNEAGRQLYASIAYDYTDGSDDEDQLQDRVVTDAP